MTFYDEDWRQLRRKHPLVAASRQENRGAIWEPHFGGVYKKYVESTRCENCGSLMIMPSIFSDFMRCDSCGYLQRKLTSKFLE